MTEVGFALEKVPDINKPTVADAGLVTVTNTTSDNWAYVDVTTLASSEEIAFTISKFIGSNTLRVQAEDQKLELFYGHTQSLEIEERFMTRDSNLVVGEYGGLITNTSGAQTSIVHNSSSLMTALRMVDTNGTRCQYTLGAYGATGRMVKGVWFASLEFVVRIPPNANSTVTIGLFIPGTANRAQFEHSNAGSGGTYNNWFVRNYIQSVTAQDIDTGVLASSDAVNLQIVRNGANMDYFINGALVGSGIYNSNMSAPLVVTVQQLAGTPAEDSALEISLLRFRGSLGLGYASVPNDTVLLK